MVTYKNVMTIIRSIRSLDFSRKMTYLRMIMTSMETAWNTPAKPTIGDMLVFLGTIMSLINRSADEHRWLLDVPFVLAFTAFVLLKLWKREWGFFLVWAIMTLVIVWLS